MNRTVQLTAQQLEQLQPLKCRCGNEEFEMVYFLKRIPALMIGAPHDVPWNIQVWKCNRCKKILDLQKAITTAAQNAIIDSRKSQ